jgi:hypothetical protein
MNYPNESDSPRVDLVDQKGSSDSESSSGGTGGDHAKRIVGASRLGVCRESLGTNDVATVKELSTDKDTSIGERPKKKIKLDEVPLTKKSTTLRYMDQIEYTTSWLLLEHQIFPENEQRMMTRIKANKTNGSPTTDIQFEVAAQAAINTNDQKALEVLLRKEYYSNKTKSAALVMGETPAREQDESTMVMGRLFLQACKHGHTAIVKFLLEEEEFHCSPRSVQDENVSTPLHHACRAAALNKQSDCLVVMLLEEHDCWPQLCLSDRIGKTPLEYLDVASWKDLYYGFLSKKSNQVGKTKGSKSASP